MNDQLFSLRRIFGALGVTALMCAVMPQSAAAHDASASFPSVQSRRVEVDGLSIFYRESGAPSAPTIVLLHGFPSSSHMFRELIPLLSDKFHVIAPDYVGFGYSAAPTVEQYPYTFDNLAQTTDRLLQKLGVTKAVFYMQDYGGPVGLRLAAKAPDRVRGLIFQNANAYLEGVSQAAIDVFMPLWQKGDDSGARKMLLADTTRFQYTAGARHPDAISPDTWTHDQALLDRAGSAERQLALFRDYQTNVAKYDEWHQYFRANQPKTLVVWGKGDPFFTPAGAEAFKKDLKDVDVRFFDTGHFALEEDARPIAALIKSRFAEAGSAK